MEVKVYNNIFENSYKTFTFNPEKPLIEQIEDNLNTNLYKETLVECYDSETGETFYAPIEDDGAGIIILANNQSVDKDYVPKESDVINVYFTPMGDNAGKVWGTIIGAVVGVALAVALVVTGGTGLPVILQAISVFASCTGLGFTIGAAIDNKRTGAKESKLKDKESGGQSPDVRGAENTSIKNDNFPFVIGKHLVTPRVIGDPVTEYSGNLGKDAFIRILLCVGYAPLKLTDFKLGDFFLSYNRDHPISGGTVHHDTIIHGLLAGYSTQQYNDGDICDYWEHNDVYLEILQQNPNLPVDYGTLYPYACDDQAINANVLFIADKELDKNATIAYKGSSFPNNFRTNGVFFTTPCPHKFTITLQFPSGIYGTHTMTEESEDASVTNTLYDRIPLWLCVQYRVVNINNSSSRNDGHDYGDWNTIDIGNLVQFGNGEAALDKAAHLGNDLSGTSLEDLYAGFLGKTLQSFEYLSGEDGSSEIRVSATVTLSEEQCRQVIQDTNPSKLVEIRVLRVSPNYMNQISTDGLEEGEGLHSYSDLVKVLSISTVPFDEQELRENNRIVDVRPMSEADMRKFCVVALKAKADASGYLVNQLKKLNCIAESFSPYWDSTQKKMFPEGVTRKVTYYGYYDRYGNKTNRSDSAREVNLGSDETAKQVYEQARNEGYSWYEEENGSNYNDIIKSIVFDNSSTRHGRPCTILSNAARAYNNNSVASSFMLACVGAQNGPTALGYDEINILSIGDWAEKTAALIDGTTFNSNTVYNGVSYHRGELVPLRMEANGYIVSGMKLENFLEKIAVCGRAMWCIDETGKIKIIMDGPVDYVKGVVSAQQCISSSNAFSYEKQPAGLFISFSDENDGYEKNQIYCWSDGNSIKNYHGQVEPFNIDFVTNPYQVWSLGRYMLGYRVLQKEMLTRKVGPEGNTYSLGDVLLIQSEDLLIGDCSGRIQEILEENGRIYGFITDATYEFEGILDGDGNSNQGVTIVQPGYLGKSKVVTLPIARANHQQVIGGKTYTQKIGTTNLVLIGIMPDNNYGVLRSSSDPSDGNAIKYNMKTGDTCMYGVRDKIAAPYRIVKIKPEKDGAFSETLVSYNEDLYQSGKMLPSFQNYITNPPVEDMLVSLSDVPTNLKEWNESQQNVYNSINAVINGGSNVGAPDLIGNLHAVAEMSKISITWSSPVSNGLKNTIKRYIVELSKNGGSTWTVIGTVYRSACEYTFDRSVDGYMEANDFNLPGKWYVRVKAENVYGQQSGYSENAEIETNNYGTYHPSNPEIISCSVTKDEIKVKWLVTNLRQPYATNIFKAFLYKQPTQEVYKGNWMPIYKGASVVYNVNDVVYVESEYKYYICNTQHTAEATFDATEKANWDEHEVYTFDIISNEYGTYTFNRQIDGYPEKTDMQDWTVKILCYNDIYTEQEGMWSVESHVNMSNYGTWQITQPIVSVKVTDRTAILKLSIRPRTDLIVPYGDLRYKVFVKRHGVAEDWWKPSQTLDVYPEFDPMSKKLIRSNELNHKDSAVVYGDWEPNTDYLIDDVVLANGAYYICNTVHTSGSTFDLDELENWATCNSLTFFRGDWSSSTLYKVDDIVYVSAEEAYYICNTEHTSESSFDETEKAYWIIYENYLTSYDTYIQTLPLKGQGINQVENTPYDFKIVAFNEAGDCPTEATVVVTALITNIRDIVKAKQDMKELYISELSALSANIGAILEGSLGDQSNMWDLSTFVDDNGVQHWKGKFRVGDENEYLYVEPLFDEQGVPTGHYKITFKMGSFEITTQMSKVNGELVVQKDEDSLDRTRITPEGTFYEHRGDVRSEWEVVAKQETRGLMSQSIYSNQSLVISNMGIAERRALGHDVGKTYLPNGTAICYHFDTDFLDQHGNTIAENGGVLDPIHNPLVPTTPHLVDESNNTPGNPIDFKPAILSFSPYSEVGKAMYGNYTLTHPLGAHKWTVDFWLEYIWFEQQSLFDVGNEGDRIQIIVSPGDPYYNTYENRVPDDPPYDYGTSPEPVYSDYMVYNNVMPSGTFVYHTSGTWEEHYTIEEKIEELYHPSENFKFLPNSWMHFGFVLTDTQIKFYVDIYEIAFDRKITGDTQGSAIFNQEKNTFCLDELYIDTVAEPFDSFYQTTLDKIPWGNISASEYNFILDVKDKNSVYTNLFDTSAFTNAVERIAGGSGTFFLSSNVVSGNPLLVGASLNIVFTANITGLDTTTGFVITYNEVDIPVMYPTNSGLVALTAKNVSGTYIYFRNKSRVSLVYDGTYFIMNMSDVVESGNMNAVTSNAVAAMIDTAITQVLNTSY